MVDLIKEADVLGSLRHPNCVWIYGMVLPTSDSNPKNIVDAIQAEAGQPSMMPGILRPPALVCEYMAAGEKEFFLFIFFLQQISRQLLFFNSTFLCEKSILF